MTAQIESTPLAWEDLPIGLRANGRAGRWRRPYVVLLIVADAVVLVGGALAAQLVRFGATNTPLAGSVSPVPYLMVSAMLAPLWILTLALSGAYNSRTLGAGTEEYRHILDASVRFVAGMAVLAYLLRIDLSRIFLALVGPLALAVTLLAHWGARRWLHASRTRGKCLQRVIVVGSRQHLDALVRHIRRVPYAGLTVVGACTGGAEPGLDIDGEHVPVVAGPSELAWWARRGGADAVIIADATVIGLEAISSFAWELEGSGVELIVAPSVTDLAGPHMAIRPVGGLPLLHVEEPRLSGAARLAKQMTERLAAALVLVGLSPVLVAIAAAVKLSSPGPVLFRQVRVGRGGQPFRMWKFRTMTVGAEDQRASVAHLNHHDGPLFKIRQDPRVTRLGRWLRRFSLDELPQLVQVLLGQMSIVGPRPPLPSEVDQYTLEAHRRLLVRPGVTGLWQVSGRSELPWLEAVRIDLYYVENWSLALDLVILAKTLVVVLRGEGAY